jgi:carboxyl-terminal processing protease
MKKIIFSLFIFSLTPFVYSQGFSPTQQLKLIKALSTISNYYVDSINDKKLVESTLQAVLRELDPHSSYIPKEEVERVNEPLEGSFEGVGIQFQIMEDTLLVVQTISGCPAEKVGVLPGDRIIFINNELVAGVKMQNSDIFKRLRGPRGSEVTVKIRRNGKPELLEFKIIRDKIPLYSVDASYMIGKEIGYIKINNFGSSTVQEFEKAMSNLQKKGMKQLILSLQGNGGGYLNAAYQLADEFLSRDKLIVYTQGLNQPKSVLKATATGNFENGKLIVLVDEYSASASEIVTGALQDWDRAIIVGRRTFGKGLVQRQFSLIDGSMMRLTTARYYTPTGRCIQKSYKKGYETYERDLYDRYKKGELLHADSIHFPDSLHYQTLNLKRTVYGGGGIMPDIFVPLDTTRFTDFHRKIVASGVVNKVLMQYVDKNRTDLKKKYTSFDKFRKEFEVNEDLMNRLISAAEKEKIKVDSSQYTISKPLIKLQLKALVARDLWEMNEYYQIMDADNESLQKAVEILQTPGAYEKILK